MRRLNRKIALLAQTAGLATVATSTIKVVAAALADLVTISAAVSAAVRIQGAARLQIVVRQTWGRF
jgi:hypothetical protein